MVRIRLIRIGGKKQPSYRIAVMDKETPRNGRFLEKLGFYNPRTQPATIQLDEKRIYDWMTKGAQPTDSVRVLFQTSGLLGRFERLKAGESLDSLVAEADAAEKARNASPKTRQE
jgi:small subunit ribosomal protein S16